jgi:hypothetical protein
MRNKIKTTIVFFLFVLILPLSGFKLQKEYCSLLAKCGLEYDTTRCPDSLKTGVKGVDYDSSRCAEARQLIEKGVSVRSSKGRLLYGFLGYKHRVEYPITSSLPVKVDRFEYLLNDLPLAAKLVNAFKKTKYKVQYIKYSRKRSFKGNKGKNLYGRASLIAGSIAEKELTYFGYGVAKILKWKLKGPVLLSFEYRPETGEFISYDLKIIAVPGSAFINIIMNMSLFKFVVKLKIKEVFVDITETAVEMEKLSIEEILHKHKWTEEEKQKLKEMMEL